MNFLRRHGFGLIPVVFGILSGMSATAWGEETPRFYTVIDESGHMRTVQSAKASTPPPSAKVKAAESSETPLTTLDGEQYVDSGYLQKREFNLEGKKQFYAVPDGLGGTQVLERVPGGSNEFSALGESDAPVEKTLPSVLVTLAEGYQRVPAREITPLLGFSCMATAALSQAKKLHNQPLNLWPRSDAIGSDHKAALNYLLVDLRDGFKDLSLQSFAPLGRRTDYYWPLVVFLDERGCVLEGVNAFYQKTLPPTMLQQAAIIGTLHVPDHSRYILLTPLVEAIDLPHIRLSEIGQLRLTPLR